jgi:NOL1/NOP2/sun family putative RNA methylase
VYLPRVIAYLERYRPLIDDWQAFVEAVSRPLAPCLWVNTTRIGVNAFNGLLEDEGISARPVAGLPGAFRLEEGIRPGQRWWFCAGLAHIQEAASQIPVHLMDLRAGQRVLDMCAAPGGKTAQIAFALDNTGTLIANDFATARIRALQGNLDRLGVVNVSTTCSDASNWPAKGGQFDRILLDAPCSSDGTLRRNPDLIGRLGADLSARLGARQRAMLRKAVQRCRPGGRILYSTCTFAPEENELVVQDVVRAYDGRVRLVAVRPKGLITSPGVIRWAGQDLDPGLAHCVRVWPHQNDTGGFFLAVLEKASGIPAAPDPVPEILRPEPQSRWLDELTSRYGLPEDLWQGFLIHRQNRRGLHLVAASHAPPAAPRGESSGLFFLRTNIRPQKLTTAGALLLGRYPRDNRIELTAEQRDAYLARSEIRPAAAQTTHLRWGQVLASYRGHPLGIAIFHRSGVLESLFPSRWSGCASGGNFAAANRHGSATRRR